MREISTLISQYISEVSFSLRNTPIPKMNVIHDTIKEYMGWSPPEQISWDFPITGTSCITSCGDPWTLTAANTGNLTFATTSDTTASTTIQGTRLQGNSGSAFDVGI